MDLSQLTTEDLKALQAGDLSKVSTAGLQALHRAHTADSINNDAISQGARDFPKEGVSGKVLSAVGGLVRGAGSIGATILGAARDAGKATLDATPVNMRPQVTAGLQDMPDGAQMRSGMDAGLSNLGADPNSLLFKGTKFGGEVMGTAGAGGAVANGLRLARAPAALADAVATGGFGGGGNALVRAAGGAINGGATAGLVDPKEAGAGAVIGGALPGAVKVAGMAGNALADAARSASAKLMQSAIKPTLAQRASGDADIAIQTLLDYGINPNKAGIEKLKSLIDEKNIEIANKIGASDATVGRESVLGRLGEVRDVFRNQVDPAADLNAIQGVADRFAEHPVFAGYEPAKQEMERALAKATSEKTTALQAAGKLETMAAQQKSLAHGQTIGLSKNQPEFQPYYNTGSLGREATSSSSLPVPGFPRIPGRYTHNIERVQEGEAGAREAMDIYRAKRAEEEAAAQALADLKDRGATMTVQEAQKLKQGTYKVLQGKYGEAGSAETEAQKGLARGLKEEIADAVPGIQGLNAEESRLIKTLDVAERRALLEMNKNPVGLSALAHNPIAAAGFMADRSAAFKALAARLINNAAVPAAGYAGQKALAGASNPMLRAAGIVATEANP